MMEEYRTRRWLTVDRELDVREHPVGGCLGVACSTCCLLEVVGQFTARGELRGVVGAEAVDVEEDEAERAFAVPVVEGEVGLQLIGVRRPLPAP